MDHAALRTLKANSNTWPKPGQRVYYWRYVQGEWQWVKDVAKKGDPRVLGNLYWLPDPLPTLASVDSVEIPRERIRELARSLTDGVRIVRFNSLAKEKNRYDYAFYYALKEIAAEVEKLFEVNIEEQE